jgi:peptidyl-tRNA hydrolase, PTH1 family
MKLIIGLGNPGLKYRNTRHNIGFEVIEELGRRWSIPCNKEKFGADIGEGFFKDEKVILLKPQTYMNRSGQAVRCAVDWIKIDIDHLIVIYDDLDLPVGHLRLRMQGNSGGHNGIRSMISHLDTNQFKRLKIGIDKPQDRDRIADYVLSPFSKGELESIKKAVQDSADAIEYWIESDFARAMNMYNSMS